MKSRRRVNSNVSPLGVCIMRKNLRQLNRGFLDAIVIGNKDEMRHLLKLGADVDATDQEHDEAAIILAVKFGDADIVELLIDAGANIDARDDEGRSALTKEVTQLTETSN